MKNTVLVGLALALAASVKSANAAAWTDAGSLATGRYEHTATKLADGRVLVVGGRTGTGSTYFASAEVFDPATGAWTGTGSMNAARYGHIAELLPDGRVLVAGGYNGAYLSSAEIWNPATGLWTSAASMAQSRYHFASARLPSGQILISGGFNGSTLTGAQRYDPGTNTWLSAPSMSQPRSGHTLTALSDGRVLLAGGSANGVRIATAQVYNPATNAWGSTGSMTGARYRHTATLLTDGRVLIAGGDNGSGSVATVQIWNPATNTWVSGPSMASIRQLHTATLRTDGTVLIAGGVGGGGIRLTASELYTPSSNVWSAGGSLSHARAEHTATLLDDGRVLAASGEQSSAGATTPTAEVYGSTTPATPGPVITSITPTSRTVGGPSFTLFVDGTGFDSTSTVFWNGSARNTTAGGTLTVDISSADIAAVGVASVTVHNAGGAVSNSASFTISPSTGPWRYTGFPTQRRSGHTATRLPSGKVLVVAGSTELNLPNDLFDPPTGSWSAVGSASARFNFTSTLLSTGKILVAGGAIQECCLADAELLDITTFLTAPTGSMNFARSGHTATLLPNGKVLAAGGRDGSNAPDITSSAELYDPTAGNWALTGSMATARTDHIAVLLGNGKVLVSGGALPFPSSGTTATAELYDPVSGIWTSTSPMAAPRSDHSATVLTDGRVLVVGGYGPTGSKLASAEVYDPATGQWAPTGAMAVPRAQHTASLLASGKVLVAGGDVLPDGRGSSSSELWDPATGAWTAAGSMASPRIGHTATVLLDGRVLAVSDNSAEIYTPGPSLAQLSPSSATAGGPQFALSVFGTRFSTGSVIKWNGASRATSFVSASTLTATILASDIASATTAQVTVFDPAGLSNALPFVVNPSTAPPPVAAFFDDFSYPDGLITNQNPASPRSPKWLVQAGSLFASGGQGWTGVPDNVSPNAGSTNGTGSAVFRAVTVSTGLVSDVTLKANVQNFVSVVAANPWDGPHVLLRFANPNNYYHVTLHRRDGHCDIKKKLNGATTTFTTPAYASALNTLRTFHAVAITNSTGSVTIQLFVDGTLIAQATDATNPLLTGGQVAIAGENVNFKFDDFAVGGSTGPKQAQPPALTALSPSSAAAGGVAFTLTVFGQRFSTSTLVEWNGSTRTTSFVSASTITAAITAQDIASSGTFSVAALDPAGLSNALPFTVFGSSQAPPSTAFFEPFNYQDGLITNSNPASPRSDKWMVTNGSLFASGGQGWTGVPDNAAPNAGSTNGTGSALFRAVTVSTGLVSDVTLKLNVQGFVSVNTPNAWDGAHVFLRFADPNNYYIVSMHRRDGHAGIKKKLNGTTTTFTTPAYASALNTLRTFRAVATTNQNGSVTIQLFVDGTLIAQATDTSNPLTAGSRFAIAGENVNFKFDDVAASTAPAAPLSMAALAASTPPPEDPAEAGAGSAAPAADSDFIVRDIYPFPNPARPGESVTIRVQPGLVDGVELAIFDLSGRKVHSGTFPPPQILDDGNGKGPQYTYDYRWNASGVGSGVYIYRVDIRKNGAPAIGKTGKVALIK